MSYIDKIEWRDGDGLEDLATLVSSIKTVAETIDNKAVNNEPSAGDIFSLNMVVMNMLESVYRCLYRFVDERKG